MANFGEIFFRGTKSDTCHIWSNIPEKSVFAPFYVGFLTFYVVFFHEMVNNIICQNFTWDIIGAGYRKCAIFYPKRQKLTPKSVFAPFYVGFCMFYVVFFHKMVDNIMCQNFTQKFFGARYRKCVNFDPKGQKLTPKSVFAPLYVIFVMFYVVLFHKMVDNIMCQNFIQKNWGKCVTFDSKCKKISPKFNFSPISCNFFLFYVVFCQDSRY